MHTLNRLPTALLKVGFDAGRAKKRPSDIWMRHKFADIVGGNAATIQDAQCCCCLAAIHLAIKLTYQMYNIASTLGSRGFTGANRPDRFIGDYYLFDMLGRKLCKALLHLSANHFLRFTRLVHLQVFADTDDGTQVVVESS